MAVAVLDSRLSEASRNEGEKSCLEVGAAIVQLPPAFAEIAQGIKRLICVDLEDAQPVREQAGGCCQRLPARSRLVGGSVWKREELAEPAELLVEFLGADALPAEPVQKPFRPDLVDDVDDLGLL